MKGSHLAKGFTTNYVLVEEETRCYRRLNEGENQVRRAGGLHIYQRDQGRASERRSVDTLERRDGLALVLVERVADDATVLEVDLGRVHVVLPRERVLHPVLVVTLSSQVG